LPIVVLEIPVRVSARSFHSAIRADFKEVPDGLRKAQATGAAEAKSACSWPILGALDLILLRGELRAFFRVETLATMGCSMIQKKREGVKRLF
jgi:hypothetical protein